MTRRSTGARSGCRITPSCSTWAWRRCRASSRGSRSRRVSPTIRLRSSSAARSADQRVIRGTLGTIVELADAHDVQPLLCSSSARWPRSRKATADAGGEPGSASSSAARALSNGKGCAHDDVDSNSDPRADSPARSATRRSSACDPLSAETGCEILGKAEFMNPGGSVKDRAARAIIDAAEKRGTLKPGGTVVEGTAGNTGIGFAHVCNARGYRCVIVMPDNQSPEKYQLLETLGAEVHKVKTVPYSEPESVPEGRRTPRRRDAQRDLGQPVRQHREPRCALARPRARRSGRRRTARSTRSCARPAPVARSPASRVPEDEEPARTLRCWPIRRAARCTTSVRNGAAQGHRHRLDHRRHRHRARHREPRRTPRSTMRCTSKIRRPCASCIGCCTRKACSSAAPAASTSPPPCGCAKQLGPGHTIVTILCDGGAKYQSRLFNPEWLVTKKLDTFAGAAPADAADQDRSGVRST